MRAADENGRQREPVITADKLAYRVVLGQSGLAGVIEDEDWQRESASSELKCAL